MADNVVIPPTTTAGPVIRTVDRGDAGNGYRIETQVVALDMGGQSGESLVSASNPLPVTMGGTAAITGAVTVGNTVAVAGTVNVGNTVAVWGTVTTAGTTAVSGTVASVGTTTVAGSVSLTGTATTADISTAGATSADAPLFVALTGDPSGDFAGVGLLEQVMSDGSGLALNVRSMNGPRADATGAAMVSDAPGAAISGAYAVGAVITLDTSGYQSLHVTADTLAASVTVSNDGKNFTALSGLALVAGAAAPTTITAGSTTVWPCLARFIRLTVTTAGAVVGYLRSGVMPAAYGANPAVASAPAVAPTGVAGVDGGGLVRRVLTDTAGRMQAGIAGADASGVARTILTDAAGRVQTGGVDAEGNPRGAATAFIGVSGLGAQVTMEAGGANGLGQTEILINIMMELRILNRTLFALASDGFVTAADDPDSYRSDPIYSS